MKQFDGLNNYISNEETVVVLGMFDGLHLGHLALLNKAEEVSCGAPITVMTFANHFRGVKKDFSMIMTMEEKIDIFDYLEIDNLIVQKVDEAFMDTTATGFIAMLSDVININSVVVGFDYTFGKDGAGGIELLKSSFKKVYVVDEVDEAGEKVSSTRLRKAIEDCDFQKYMDLCGRPYSVTGIVSHGNSIGKENGTPTINIPICSQKLLPPDGVYMTRVKFGQKIYNSIANLGSAPTFNRNEKILEVHLFNFSGDAYGQKAQVMFYKHIRDIKKFFSSRDLYAQITKDIEITMNFFKHLK